MWTRSLLKLNAKQVLATNYWMAFLVCLLSGILGGASIGNTSAATSQWDTNSYNYSSSSFVTLYEFWGMFVTVAMVVFFIAAAIGMCFNIFVTNVVVVGQSRYFMESRGGKSPIATLFSVFGRPGYLNVVKVMFLKNLFVFLWSLLFIIPGIYKSYQYRMVNYLLAENPYMDYRRALELSREMTKDEKFNIFILDLSFIGWYFLGALACGVGVLFVRPYMQATYAELYAALRAKAFTMNLTDTTELGGFMEY